MFVRNKSHPQCVSHQIINAFVGFNGNLRWCEKLLRLIEFSTYFTYNSGGRLVGRIEGGEKSLETDYYILSVMLIKRQTDGIMFLGCKYAVCITEMDSLVNLATQTCVMNKSSLFGAVS